MNAAAATSPELVLTSVYQATLQRVEQIRLLVEHAADDDNVSVESYNAMADDLLRAEADLEVATKSLYLSSEPCAYILRDGESGYSETVIASSDKDACRQAREWARGGDWDLSGGTIWVDVHVIDLCGESERVTVQIDPPEPACADEHEHKWCSPYSLLGGLEENPGVQGNGGGVVITEVCKHCGCYRVTDTWAQRPDTGEQGLHSTMYRDADDESLAWVNSNA